MNKKSKLVTFILSFIPGLAHIYLGYLDRAFVFFLLFFGIILGTGGLALILHQHEFIFILGLLLPIIWLISLVDAISLADKSGYSGNDSEMLQGEKEEVKSFKDENKKVIAVGLSVIPGAGHMYLGLQREGLILMSMFFFDIFLMSWLNMSFFLFLLPVIWFYSIFDTLHSLEGKSEEYHTDSYLFSLLDNNPKIVGWSLIGLGILAIFNRIIMPLLPWRFQSYLQTIIVAAILIVTGIRLLKGPKENSENAEKAHDCDDYLEERSEDTCNKEE